MGPSPGNPSSVAGMVNLEAANARSDEIKVAASRSSEMRVSFMLIVSMVFSRAKVSAFDLF
jgi:hypothetical protein